MSTSPIAGATPESPAASTLSRRHLVQGLSWGVPVVAMAVAAPLAAASPCGTATLNWNTNYTRTSSTLGGGDAITTSGRSVPYTVQAIYSPGFAASGQSLTYTNAGGPRIQLVGNTAISTTSADRNDDYNMTTRITFDNPVSDVTFSIWDVDSTSDARSSTEYVTVTAPGATAVGGSGLVNENGWWRSIARIDASTTNPAYSLAYTIPGPVTTFDIVMSRPGIVGFNGGVLLSNLTFAATC